MLSPTSSVPRDDIVCVGANSIPLSCEIIDNRKISTRCTAPRRRRLEGYTDLMLFRTESIGQAPPFCLSLIELKTPFGPLKASASYDEKQQLLAEMLCVQRMKADESLSPPITTNTIGCLTDMFSIHISLLRSSCVESYLTPHCIKTPTFVKYLLLLCVSLNEDDIAQLIKDSSKARVLPFDEGGEMEEEGFENDDKENASHQSRSSKSRGSKRKRVQSSVNREVDKRTRQNLFIGNDLEELFEQKFDMLRSIENLRQPFKVVTYSSLHGRDN